MDIHEIRRANLLDLVNVLAGGNLTKLVEVNLAGTVGYKVLQRIAGKTARHMGSALARRIEKQVGMERGWMDQNHSGTVSALHGRNERVLRIAQSIEALSPTKRELVEQLVNVLTEPPGPKRRTKKKTKGG